MSEMNREEDAISVGSSASSLSRISDDGGRGRGSNNDENDPPPAAAAAAAVNNSTTATATSKAATAATKRKKSSTGIKKKQNGKGVPPPHVSYQRTLLPPPTTALANKPRSISPALLKPRKKKKDKATEKENEQNYDMLIIQAKSLQDDVTAFYEGAKEVVQNYYDEATAAGDAFASLKSTTTDEGSLASQVASLKAQVEQLEQRMKEAAASNKREAKAHEKSIKVLTDQNKALVKEKEGLQAQVFALHKIEASVKAQKQKAVDKMEMQDKRKQQKTVARGEKLAELQNAQQTGVAIGTTGAWNGPAIGGTHNSLGLGLTNDHYSRQQQQPFYNPGGHGFGHPGNQYQQYHSQPSQFDGGLSLGGSFVSAASAAHPRSSSSSNRRRQPDDSSVLSFGTAGRSLSNVSGQRRSSQSRRGNSSSTTTTTNNNNSSQDDELGDMVQRLMGNNGNNPA